MTKLSAISAAVLFSMTGGYAMHALAGDVVIESWRTDDKDLWEDVLIPTFNSQYPDINVSFAPTNPPDYNATMDSRFKGGTAGDLVTCRPFEVSLSWFNRGFLAPRSTVKPVWKTSRRSRKTPGLRAPRPTACQSPR